MEDSEKVSWGHFLFLIATLVLGCKPVAKMSVGISEIHPQIETLVSLRAQSQAAIMSQYIIGRRFVKYLEKGKFKGITKESYKMPPMYFSFSDSAVWYISCSFEEAEKDTASYSLSKILKVLGEPRKSLPSVMRYPWREYHYPELGLDFTVNVEKDYYSYVAVFQPTTWKRYKRYFWNDPSQYPSRH
jgi:hypothetical protein